MSRKKSSVLLEVDRSIIENNLLIQVKSVQTIYGIIPLYWKQLHYQYRLTNITDCTLLKFIHMHT